MGGQGAIETVQRRQPVAQHQEMPRLVIRHLDPVIEEAARQIAAGKARGDIPGQVNGVQFDMCQRVQQGSASGGGGGDLALLHPAGRQQVRLFRPRRPVGRQGVADFDQHALAPGGGNLAAEPGLLHRVGRLQHGDSGLGEAGERQEFHSVQAGVMSFRPTMPATIMAMQAMRMISAASLNRKMPSTTVPTVPMPVQIA